MQSNLRTYTIAGSQTALHFHSVGCTVVALVSGRMQRVAKVLRTVVF
jgi:hypothetical protein